MTTSSGVLAFPNPVNENAARVVQAGVAVLAVITLLTGWHILIAVMAVGFLARTLTGPRLSPLSWLAQRVAPRLGAPRFVPGPPKRLSQAVGLVLTTVAAVASLGFGEKVVAATLLVVVLVLALMEIIGICVPCPLFTVLLRHGLLPRATSDACQAVWNRYGGNPLKSGPVSDPLRH